MESLVNIETGVWEKFMFSWGEIYSVFSLQIPEKEQIQFTLTGFVYLDYESIGW